MGVLELVLPPSCAGCGRFGALLCRRCVGSMRRPSDARDRFFAPDAGVVVGDALELAASAFAYEGAVRRALQRLKYGHGARVARVLAAAAAPRLVELVDGEPNAVLVPVPLHPDRERERGYNQAALLASHLAREARRPTAELLVRVRFTTRMHALDKAARARNLAGAFAVRGDLRDSPRTAVIVDDIMTTSATLEACATALRAAGTKRVLGFTVAREV